MSEAVVNWIGKWLPTLQKYTPKTLFGRSMLIIALPVLIMQIAVVYTFFDRHWQRVSTSLSEGVAGDIAVVLDLYADNPTPENLDALAQLARTNMNLSAALYPDERLPTSSHGAFNSPLNRTLREALSSSIDRPFWFDTDSYPAYIEIQVQVGDGVFRFYSSRDRVYATTGDIFVTWLVGATLLLTGIAIVFTRAQLRPIQELARAAERLGKGQESPDFKPTGAEEVRQASKAFIQMQRRLSRFINQRTEMLAGVSHDLRTPLTRLKLQFAMMDKTPELDAARQDVQHMQDMLEGYLDFARGDALAEPIQLDLAKMTADLVKKCVPSDHLAEIKMTHPLPVMVRAQSIERCLTNLLENATRYAGRTWISGDIAQNMALIYIDDDGPGIQKEDREDAFRPFNRLDEARNLNTEGVGLGLAIARDAARAHGGEIHLETSPYGGLRVQLRLPLFTKRNDQSKLRN